MTPTWLQGQWKDVESDRIITITENRISSDGIDVRNAQEDFSTNTTYGVSTEVFRVTVLKTSDKMFFKYFENSEVVVSSYFEKL